MREGFVEVENSYKTVVTMLIIYIVFLEEIDILSILISAPVCGRNGGKLSSYELKRKYVPSVVRLVRSG
jgi:hypothetical protein